jgi:hypothetical protein
LDKNLFESNEQINPTFERIFELDGPEVLGTKDFEIWTQPWVWHLQI